MANIIKIKRSSSTAAPTSLQEGELAFSFLSGKLYVGNSSAVIPIGGVHHPGTLTANQALVANSTLGIDKIIVANLVPTFVTANGALGTTGQVLSANSTGGVYWDTPVSSLDSLTDVTLTSVTNNDILVYDAGAGQWENHTATGNAGQIDLTFTAQNITVSLPQSVTIDSNLTVGNSSVNSTINSTAVVTNTFSITGGITIGQNVSINTSTIFVGNSTVNTTIQAGNIALLGTQLLVGNTLFTGELISVGNSTVNSVVNTTAVSTNVVTAAAQVQVGSNVVIDTSTITVGNSTVNAALTSTSLTLDGTITAGNTDLDGFINVSSTANIGGAVTARSDVTVNGALTVANTATLGNTTVDGFVSVGNSTVNAVVNSTALVIGSNIVIDTSTITVGNSTVNSVVNSTAVNVDGEFTGHRFLSSNISLQAPTAGDYDGERLRLYDFADGRINYAIGVEASHIWTAVDGHSNTVGFKWYGNNVLAARLGGTGTLELKDNLYTDGTAYVNVAVSVGNSSVNAVINSSALAIGSNVVLGTAALSIGNSSVNTAINSSSITTGSANLGVATIGNTTITGWANVAGDLNVNGNIVLGDSFGTDVVSFKSTVNTEISPSANNQYKLGRADLRWGEVNGDKILGANVTVGVVLDVQGNTTLGSNASDIVTFNALVNSFIIPSANLTYSLGNNTLYWLEVHAGNVHADQGYFEHDVEIKGDLTVFGNLVTTNVQSVIISDPLIYLAGNNYTSDLVDIGFAGNYHQGGVDKHTGLFRDASVDQYYLFKGLTQELDGELTVNTADPTFALADLNAWLLSGALVSNSGGVTITANATVNVNITANSLSLSTALAVGSGGTGTNTFTAKGVLYGNGTSALEVTAAGTDGQVLQANSTGYPVWGDLDGGTF